MLDSVKEFFNKKNTINLLLLGILALAIPITVQLAKQQQIFRGKAAGEPIQIFGPSVTTVNGKKYTTSKTVKVKLIAPSTITSQSTHQTLLPNGGLISQVKAQSCSCDSSKASEVCEGQTYADTCGNLNEDCVGTKRCCVCNPNQAANICQGQSYANSCGELDDSCVGTKYCAGNPLPCTCDAGSAAEVCEGTTYANSCGELDDSCVGTKDCSGGSLSGGTSSGGSCDPNDQSKWQPVGYSACVSSNPPKAAEIFSSPCDSTFVPHWKDEVDEPTCGAADQTTCWAANDGDQDAANGWCNSQHGDLAPPVSAKPLTCDPVNVGLGDGCQTTAPSTPAGPSQSGQQGQSGAQNAVSVGQCRSCDAVPGSPERGDGCACQPKRGDCINSTCGEKSHTCGGDDNPPKTCEGNIGSLEYNPPAGNFGQEVTCSNCNAAAGSGQRGDGCYCQPSRGDCHDSICGGDPPHCGGGSDSNPQKKVCTGGGGPGSASGGSGTTGGTDLCDLSKVENEKHTQPDGYPCGHGEKSGVCQNYNCNTTTGVCGSVAPKCSGTTGGGQITIKYKLAEAPDELDAATEKSYQGEGTEDSYTFKNDTPGEKVIYVRFIAKDSTGRVVATVDKSDAVTLLGSNPKISEAACDPATENNVAAGTKITIKGTNFGSKDGTVKVGDETAKVDSWSSTQIAATLPHQFDNVRTLTVTTEGGQVDTSSCGINVSQLELKVKKACVPKDKQGSGTLSIKIQDIDSKKVVATQDNLSPDSQGKIKVPFKTQSGKKLAAIIDAAGFLSERIEFTPTTADTYSPPQFNLLPCDIYPEEGDNLCNSFDRSELYKEWSPTQPVSKPGDFNRDDRINSLDASCQNLGLKVGTGAKLR